MNDLKRLKSLPNIDLSCIPTEDGVDLAISLDNFNEGLKTGLLRNPFLTPLAGAMTFDTTSTDGRTTLAEYVSR